MTISSETSRINYVGDGTVSVYDYNFKIFSDTDLLVTTRTSAGVENELALGSNYTVTGVGNESGGSITLVAGALASGTSLTIRRSLDLLQETDIRNQGRFFPEVHENAFDESVMRDQQIQDQVNRCIRGSETDTTTSVGFVLPPVANRANRVLAFDNAGQVIAGQVADTGSIPNHASEHKDGGDDEVSTSTAAAGAIPKALGTGKLDNGWINSATTSVAGIVELASDSESAASLVVQANDTRLSNARTPLAHNTSHQSGGADSIKLDDLATPDDNTDLNASVSRHGLLLKLSGNSSDVLIGTGAWSTPSSTPPASPFENSIESCRHDANGVPNFLAVSSGLTCFIFADATDPFVINVDGTPLSITSSITVNATDNAHNFVYVTNGGTHGISAFPCTYSFIAPTSPSSGQFWFSLNRNKMYSWNGSSWVATPAVFVGYIRADSGVVSQDPTNEPVGATPLWRWQNFGTGADGWLDISSGTTTVDGLKNYSAVTIRGTGALVHTASGGSTTEKLMQIFSQSIVSLYGTAMIELSGRGHASGLAEVGYGAAGGGGGGVSPTLSSAGNGRINPQRPLGTIAANSGGGSASTGVGGTGNPSLWPIGGIRDLVFSYGASGGSGATGTGAGGAGGNGGGSCDIRTPALFVGSSAGIFGNGGNGSAGAGGNSGGGGGGGGGVIQIVSRSHRVAGTFASNGGAGGAGTGTGSSGGPGGLGKAYRVAI